MTEQHERRISHKELTSLAFRCKSCQAEFTLDLTNEEQGRRLEDMRGEHWQQCSFCGTHFDSSLRGSLRLLVDWRRRLEQAGYEIVFRLPAPS